MQWDESYTFKIVTMFPRLDGTYKLSLFNCDRQLLTTKEGAASESITFEDKEWETTHEGAASESITFDDKEWETTHLGEKSEVGGLEVFDLDAVETQ